MKISEIILLMTFIIFSLQLKAKEVETNNDNKEIYLNTAPNVDDWGMDIGFGIQPYMDKVSRIKILFPKLFSTKTDKAKLTVNILSKDISDTLTIINHSSLGEISLNLEFYDQNIYKDIIYSYVSFGLGIAFFNDIKIDDKDVKIYDGLIFKGPISIGLQIVAKNTKKIIISHFIEYNFSFTTFNKNKLFPDGEVENTNLSEKHFFSNTFYYGLRFNF